MPVYANSHRELEANLVGAIGEVVFERWLHTFEIPFDRTGTTQDDDRVGPAKWLVEVKTKDRTVRPQGDYAVSIPAYNADLRLQIGTCSLASSGPRAILTATERRSWSVAPR